MTAIIETNYRTNLISSISNFVSSPMRGSRDVNLLKPKCSSVKEDLSNDNLSRKNQICQSKTTNNHNNHKHGIYKQNGIIQQDLKTSCSDQRGII